MSTKVNPFVASARSITCRERRLMADLELAELLPEPRLSPFNRLCAARKALRTGEEILAAQEAEEKARAAAQEAEEKARAAAQEAEEKARAAAIAASAVE
jgi:hypothetical protein